MTAIHLASTALHIGEGATTRTCLHARVVHSHASARESTRIRQIHRESRSQNAQNDNPSCGVSILDFLK